MSNTERIELIKQRLTQALQPTQLKVIDDSARHRNHPGAKDGRGHFILHIQSAALAGKTSLEQHRMIYAALGDLMQTDIHAINIHIAA